MLRNEDVKQISEWMGNKENIEKLSALEIARMNEAYLCYIETIAPIIIKAMARDENARFLFKL